MPIALSIMASYHRDARRSTLASLTTKRKTANLIDDVANIATVVRGLVGLALAVTAWLAVDWRRVYGIFRFIDHNAPSVLNEVLRDSYPCLTPGSSQVELQALHTVLGNLHAPNTHTAITNVYTFLLMYISIQLQERQNKIFSI
jgi:hypothetical protein